MQSQRNLPNGCEMGSERFKFIIIGGSIAGLVLVHCLDKASIDYVVLEKRQEITAQEVPQSLICPIVAVSPDPFREAQLARLLVYCNNAFLLAR